MTQPDFDPESGTLLLPLNKDDVGLGDEPVTFEGRRFQPKSEVHITLIGKDLGEQVVETLTRNAEASEHFQRAVRETDWQYRLAGPWFHVSQAQEDGTQAETIIRMAEIPGVRAFYARLGEILGRAVAVPPAHVTLYTRNTAEGIGLANEEEFRRCVVREVEPEELQKVKVGSKDER